MKRGGIEGKNGFIFILVALTKSCFIGNKMESCTSDSSISFSQQSHVKVNELTVPVWDYLTVIFW